MGVSSHNLRTRQLERVAGSGVPPGTNVSVNTTNVANGEISVMLDSSGGPLKAGVRQVVKITLHVRPDAPGGAGTVAFADAPTAKQLVLADFSTATPVYTAGTITVAGPRRQIFKVTNAAALPGFGTGPIDLVGYRVSYDFFDD